MKSPARAAVKLAVPLKLLSESKQALISLKAVLEASASAISFAFGALVLVVALLPLLVGSVTWPRGLFVAINVTVAVSPKFRAGVMRILSKSASMPVPLATKLPLSGSRFAPFKGAIMLFTDAIA